MPGPDSFTEPNAGELSLIHKEDLKYSGAPPCRTSMKTWFVTAGFLTIFFYLYLFWQKEVLYTFIAIPMLFALLFLISSVRLWILLIIGLSITFGSRAIDYGVFYTQIATLGVLASFFVYTGSKVACFSDYPRYPLPVFLILAAYSLQLMSVFHSLHVNSNLVSNTLREGHKLFIGALLIPLVYDWYGSGQWFLKMLKMLTLMLLVMGIYGYYQYYYGNLDNVGELASGYDLAGRIYSTVAGGPNSYSGVLELLVPTILAASFYFKSRSWKFLALLSVIIGIQNVLLTFSRGGFLTVAGACALYLVVRHRRKLWIPLTAVGVFVAVILTNPETFDRQLRMMTDPTQIVLDTSIMHRYTAYKGFLEEIGQDPARGIGWGNVEFFHGRSSLYSFWEVRHESSVNKINRFGGLNSLVLEMPLKGGALSALSLLLMFSAYAVTSVKVMRKAPGSPATGMMLGIGAFGVHQFVDNLIPWPQTGAVFWLIFALFVSVGYPCCGKPPDSL